MSKGATEPAEQSSKPSPSVPMDLLKRLRAKSNPPELLTAHLAATLAAARELQSRVGRVEIADGELAGHFWTTVAWATLTHDAGKVPNGFQDMVNGRATRWGERHEVLSLGFLPHLIEDDDLLRWVAVAVVTHHRPLTGENYDNINVLYGQSDLEEFNQRLGPIPDDAVAALADWLANTASANGLPVCAGTAPLNARKVTADAHRTLGMLLDQWRYREVSNDHGLACVLLQGAVTLSDHLSSAHRSFDLRQPLDASLRARMELRMVTRGSGLRAHQRRAAEIHGHLLLRAPTGSGKTEAALLWAATQVADIAGTTGGVPRTFYTLPYLASINAMATRLAEFLGDETTVGVAHSRAASYHLARAGASDDGGVSSEMQRVTAAAKAVSREAATRHFRETVRVSTPYQLIRAALGGAAYSGALIDAANSIFILDELHAYDERRLGYLLAIAQVWERLGGRIAVISATLPDALAEVIGSTLDRDMTTVDGSGENRLHRHRLNTRPYHLTDESAFAEIRRRLHSDQSVLVVANNVADALSLFGTLAPEASGRYGADGAQLLHSRFRRGDRMEIEGKITSRYGASRPRQPGLVVATQTIEVSLDVDFDVLFTSAAPLEALLQRFGRVNRIAARPPADVIIHAPRWMPRRNTSDEFADGVYRREPTDAAWTALQRRAGAVIDELEATDWLNDIYVSSWGIRWRQEVTSHRDSFTRSLLTFDPPYDDREPLSSTFDRLFDGVEAVLADDLEAYQSALQSAKGRPGRLLADEYLIPMPYWAAPLGRYERSLKVRIVEGEYDVRRGLLSIRGPDQDSYRPGEIL